ncbi:MAG: ABC transporter ATP-binding protein [Bacillota bacterium]|jgi:putative ABC transport system ATP-binding protein|nr:ABC transporter ATP-binding protein [Bacillota bacterium]HHU43121.1 ABC transporter ATP-binding protein [Clostridiales bacterium]
MIKVKNLVKVYGEGDSAERAIDDITLEIPEAKFVAIMGKSGCGKTTFLNLIGGLDYPSSGEIFCKGIRLNDLSNNQLSDYRNKNIGYVFQDFYLEPSFTTLENVEMPLIIAGMPKKERRQKAIELLNRLGLEDKIHKKVNTLSGGQKQRAAIARALVHSPSIILADEPTGNLDSKNGAEVIAILKQISLEGKTVILATHNKEDAMKADYIIELVDGRVSKRTEADHEEK